MVFVCVYRRRALCAQGRCARSEEWWGLAVATLKSSFSLSGDVHTLQTTALAVLHLSATPRHLPCPTDLPTQANPGLSVPTVTEADANRRATAAEIGCPVLAS